MRNAKSVILTAVFAVIIIYLFAICGYLFIQDDFLMEVNPKTFDFDNENLNSTSINQTYVFRKLSNQQNSLLYLMIKYDLFLFICD